MKKRALFLITSLIFSGCGEKPEDVHKHVEHVDHEKQQIVHMQPEFQEMIRLKLEPVVRQKRTGLMDVVGELAQETDRVEHVTSEREGVLEAYLVELGATVDAGTALCRLRLKDGSTHEVKAESHGTVLAKYLELGDRVDILTSLMTIADPDVMRAGFDIYERDLAKVALGQSVRVKSAAYPGQVFNGRVVFISPRVDTRTRTVKIRVDIENEEHLLKFGMFVTGEIEIATMEEGLYVPENAVQRLEDGNVVFLPGDDGDEFEIREVRTGVRAGGSIEILEGLAEGDRVVSAGSFYLKSELLKGEFGDGHNH